MAAGDSALQHQAPKRVIRASSDPATHGLGVVLQVREQQERMLYVYCCTMHLLLTVSNLSVGMNALDIVHIGEI